MDGVIGILALIAISAFVAFVQTSKLAHRLLAAAICGASVGLVSIYSAARRQEMESVASLAPWNPWEAWIFMIAAGGIAGLAVGVVVMVVQGAGRDVERKFSMISRARATTKKKRIEDAEREEAVYEEISKELESGNIDRPTWLKAYEKSDGDQQRAKAEYIRLRKKRLLNG